MVECLRAFCRVGFSLSGDSFLGPWMGCGCSSIFMILAGVLLVMGGCLRMFGQ
jgi:hypothetical protein